MAKLYQYVGPANILNRTAIHSAGTPITSVPDLASWMKDTGQSPNPAGLVAVTFVIDEQGRLLVADRGSEHIACSGGKSVLSAGEMFFDPANSDWRVVEVSNQSTGFCPEPESWVAVAAALDHAGIGHPHRFTLAIVFRRCPSCGQRNVVKDNWFVCGVCEAELPAEWNFAQERK